MSDMIFQSRRRPFPVGETHKFNGTDLRTVLGDIHYCYPVPFDTGCIAHGVNFRRIPDVDVCCFAVWVPAIILINLATIYLLWMVSSGICHLCIGSKASGDKQADN